jgi:hypothetical protein
MRLLWAYGPTSQRETFAESRSPMSKIVGQAHFQQTPHG